MKQKFVQIHSLTSYGPALLNRDDAGFAKRIPFGGTSRTRVSSQCLKRHWRTFEGDNGFDEIGVPSSVRSRMTFDRFVVQPLVEEGHSENAVRAATEAYMSILLGESAKAKASKAEREEEGEVEALKTGQITILGRPEIEFVKSEVKEVVQQHREELESAENDKKAWKKAEKNVAKTAKSRIKGEGKKNLQAMEMGAGLDAALFGRMVTSDILSRVDAAVHVAHAMTVHAESSESDYFSAVDDLLQGEDGELGSGHINSTELTTGLFYGYSVIDLPLLISNITGAKREDWENQDPSLAAEVLKRLIHLVATVSPGAKLGSTAPYAHASFMMVESGNRQPRTLANAFLKAVSPRPDLLSNTYEVLGGHLADLDTMYGKSEERRFVGIGNTDLVAQKPQLEKSESLSALAQWAANQVQGG
jgi:CRISPR system Cascade subunit CasC